MFNSLQKQKLRCQASDDQTWATLKDKISLSDIRRIYEGRIFRDDKTIIQAVFGYVYGKIVLEELCERIEV